MRSFAHSLEFELESESKTLKCIGVGVYSVEAGTDSESKISDSVDLWYAFVAWLTSLVPTSEKKRKSLTSSSCQCCQCQSCGFPANLGCFFLQSCSFCGLLVFGLVFIAICLYLSLFFVDFCFADCFFPNFMPLLLF